MENLFNNGGMPPEWYINNRDSIYERERKHIKEKHPDIKISSWSYMGDEKGNLKSHICNECGEEILIK